jgi:hypothetical protein
MHEKLQKAVEGYLHQERRVAEDGWIHDIAESPSERVSVGIIWLMFAGLAVFFPFYDYVWLRRPSGLGPLGLVMGAGTVIMLLLYQVGKPLSRFRYNYCPECNRRTDYNPKQSRCPCGYTLKRDHHLNHVVGIVAVLLLMTVPGLTEAQHVPVSSQAGDEQAASTSLVNPYEVYPSFITKDQVARDVTPEFLNLVNQPTWEHAVIAYQKQVLNMATLMEGIRLFAAVKGYYEDKIKTEQGLTLEQNPFEFYAAMLREFGYADIRIQLPDPLAKYDPFSLNPANVTRLLQRALEAAPNLPSGGAGN